MELVVGFTGHRTYGGQADGALDAHLTALYGRGARTFVSGMAVGFDMAAAEAVLGLRARYADVRLVCAVPFEGQEARFPAADRERYARLLAAADERVTVCPRYAPGCYARRNDYLVDRAGVLVAWYDGSSGGTRYTLRRALRRGREVVNLCPEALLPVRQPELF